MLSSNIQYRMLSIRLVGQSAEKQISERGLPWTTAGPGDELPLLISENWMELEFAQVQSMATATVANLQDQAVAFLCLFGYQRTKPSYSSAGLCEDAVNSPSSKLQLLAPTFWNGWNDWIGWTAQHMPVFLLLVSEKASKLEKRAIAARGTTTATPINVSFVSLILLIFFFVIAKCRYRWPQEKT